MIPQKEKNSSLDEQLNKDIEEAEKKSKEDVKNSRPKLAQAVAMKYAKYATILFLTIGIVYKMFFSGADTAKTERNKTKKTTKKRTKKAGKNPSKTQQQETFKNASTTAVRDKPEQQDNNKVKEITSNTLNNAENLKLIAVPKAETPELPKLPDIKTITITQEGEQSVIVHNSELEKKLEAQQKEIEELKKQNEDNKKKVQELSKKKDSKKDSIREKKNSKKDNKNTDDDDRKLLKDSPISKQDESSNNYDEEKTQQEKQKKNNGGKKKGKNNSENKSLLERMFILAGKNGTKQKKENSSNSKNDFVIFDNSSISIKEELSEQQASSVKKMQNLEYTIMSGKIIDGVLETAIDSQFSGTVRGIVSKDVYGETGEKILIPKGSRLYGSYAKSTSKTQYRLLLTWSKIVRPDGVVISVNLDTYDQVGRKGIEGDVNTQYGELFKNSLLYSFVTLGTAVALEKIAGIKGTTISSNGATSYATISPAATAAQSVVATAQDIAEKMTDGITDDLDSIITIPQGIQLKIMPSSDIVIPTPYKRKKYNINFD